MTAAWISVDVELPAGPFTVLVHLVVRHRAWVWLGYYHEASWRLVDGSGPAEVLNWQPLPAAPPRPRRRPAVCSACGCAHPYTGPGCDQLPLRPRAIMPGVQP